MSDHTTGNDHGLPAGEVREFAQGVVILRQGDTSRDMYIIESGLVQVSLESSTGAVIPLATLGPGDFFGEMSFFAEESRSANVTALTAVRARTVSRGAIEQELRHAPPWFREIVLKLVERVRYANLAILGQAESQSELLELERVRAALSVAGAVAHEVNQPLTVLIAATQLLDRKLEQTDHLETSATIVRNAHRVADILRRLQSIRTFVTKPYAGSEMQILDLERATEGPSAPLHPSRQGGSAPPGPDEPPTGGPDA